MGGAWWSVWAWPRPDAVKRAPPPFGGIRCNFVMIQCESSAAGEVNGGESRDVGLQFQEKNPQGSPVSTR